MTFWASRHVTSQWEFHFKWDTLNYTPSKWQFICLEKKSTKWMQLASSFVLLCCYVRKVVLVQRRKSPRKFRRARMSYDKSSPNNIAKVDWLGTPLCNQPVLMTILVQSNPEPSNYTVFFRRSELNLGVQPAGFTVVKSYRPTEDYKDYLRVEWSSSRCWHFVDKNRLYCLSVTARGMKKLAVSKQYIIYCNK